MEPKLFPAYAGIRSKLNAPETVWTKELDIILSVLDPEPLEHGWNVHDTIYNLAKQGIYNPVIPTNSPKYEIYPIKNIPYSSAQFHYQPPNVTRTDKWGKHISNFWVTYTNSYDKKYDHTDPDHLIKTTPKKYVIGGLLADPLITQDPETAARHITTQFTKVQQRINYHYDIEHAFAQTLPDNYLHPDITHATPAGIKYVGDDTLTRLAEIFGTYTNILLYDEERLASHLSYAYGNNPDAEQIYTNILEATDQYHTNLENKTTTSELSPDHLQCYPQDPLKNPTVQEYKPHTEQ